MTSPGNSQILWPGQGHHFLTSQLGELKLKQGYQTCVRAHKASHVRPLNLSSTFCIYYLFYICLNSDLIVK
jgi:hypothetical protein